LYTASTQLTLYNKLQQCDIYTSTQNGCKIKEEQLRVESMVFYVVTLCSWGTAPMLWRNTSHLSSGLRSRLSKKPGQQTAASAGFLLDLLLSPEDGAANFFSNTKFTVTSLENFPNITLKVH
jgi:hypothetical protein